MNRRSASGQPPNTSAEVEAWLVERNHPLDDGLRLARAIILEANPAIAESIKWQTPTFSYRGNLASFSPSKRVISLMFHRGAEIPGHHPRLEGDGAQVRTMRFADVAAVEDGRADLVAVVDAWCLWRDEAD
ncbi:MAG: DUF1801 domain-containing protein [Actinomycetota bacterium]